jgi:hypothetical protein
MTGTLINDMDSRERLMNRAQGEAKVREVRKKGDGGWQPRRDRGKGRPMQNRVLSAVSDGASTTDEIQTSVHMTSRSRDGDALLQASCPSARTGPRRVVTDRELFLCDAAIEGEDLARKLAKRAMWTCCPESKQGSSTGQLGRRGCPPPPESLVSTASCRFMGEGTHRIHRPRAQQASKEKKLHQGLGLGPSNREDRKRRVVQKEEIKGAQTPNSRRPSLGVVRSPTSAGRAAWNKKRSGRKPWERQFVRESRGPVCPKPALAEMSIDQIAIGSRNGLG